MTTIDNKVAERNIAVADKMRDIYIKGGYFEKMSFFEFVLKCIKNKENDIIEFDSLNKTEQNNSRIR